MNTVDQYTGMSMKCSRIATEEYSTSFASAIRLLHKDLQGPIHAIYGLVRCADEIVDTFHTYDKAALLARFKEDTFHALEQGISLNPVLQAFQATVRKYHIDHALIHAFFRSMEMDLEKKTYHNEQELNEYIYGSAEVVGLICLYIFCEGSEAEYKRLEPGARALGAAFQKVNFLRDLKADFNGLARSYFPGVDLRQFDAYAKSAIERSIHEDFDAAYTAIRELPAKARLGVYVAYRYYFSLFRKIRRLPAAEILEHRIRIPDFMKIMIVCRAGISMRLNMI
jgi:phytoene/squalene synthetase